MPLPLQTRAAATTAIPRPDHIELRGKRVAMVTYSPYPQDERPRRAIDAFRDQGILIDLICIGDDGSSKHEHAEGLNVLRVPMKHRRGGTLTYALQYGSFLFVAFFVFALRTFRRRYDLVYVHNMPDILVVSALIPKAFGAKVILDLHDPMPELMTTIFGLDQNSFSVRAIRWMESWSIARTDMAITVNEACKKIFAARSCKPEKILVVMNTPDTKLFPFHPAQDRRIGRDSTDKPFVFMYHGTLVERNGLNLAVEALGQVRSKIPNVEMRVYGPETPFLQQVMSTVRAKGMQDIVHYFGPRRHEDLVPEIEACDVGVIPNQRNSFTDINTPARIFDYVAVGKPAIVPRTEGITDYFNDDSLIFFESGNAANLAAQMAHAYFNFNDLTALVANAQQIYLAHSWEQEREKLLCGVSKVLN